MCFNFQRKNIQKITLKINMQRDRLTEEGGERGKKREQRKETAAEKEEKQKTLNRF